MAGREWAHGRPPAPKRLMGRGRTIGRRGERYLRRAGGAPTPEAAFRGGARIRYLFPEAGARERTSGRRAQTSSSTQRTTSSSSLQARHDGRHRADLQLLLEIWGKRRRATLRVPRSPMDRHQAATARRARAALSYVALRTDGAPTRARHRRATDPLSAAGKQWSAAKARGEQPGEAPPRTLLSSASVSRHISRCGYGAMLLTPY